MPLDHERLIVYQRALSFITWATDLLASTGPCGDVRGQLDRASTSVPLNIAEGNGKFTPRDRVKYLDIAQGSALECAACLDVLVAKRVFAAEAIVEGKAMIEEAVNRLNRLRQSVEAREAEGRSGYRVKEGEPEVWWSLRDVEEAEDEDKDEDKDE